MPTRNVVLTDHQNRLVEELVESGRYQNASEVLRDGLRLLERQQAELAEIQAGIVESFRQDERGDYAEGTLKDVFSRVFENAKKMQGT